MVKSSTASSIVSVLRTQRFQDMPSRSEASHSEFGSSTLTAAGPVELGTSVNSRNKLAEPLVYFLAVRSQFAIIKSGLMRVLFSDVFFSVIAEVRVQGQASAGL